MVVLLLGGRKKREHLVTMATEMFQKKYELFFLEEIRYFPWLACRDASLENEQHCF